MSLRSVYLLREDLVDSGAMANFVAARGQRDVVGHKPRDRS
jgi:hypothetical protein